MSIKTFLLIAIVTIIAIVVIINCTWWEILLLFGGFGVLIGYVVFAAFAIGYGLENKYPKNYMIQSIFQIVAKILLKIAQKMNLTYNEVNILVYYLVIPLSWCIMIDCLIGMPVTTLLLIVVWAVIFLKVKSFSEWCDKGFKQSQRFILFFGEYEKYSVIICVLIPILIYAILIALLLY